MYLHIFKAKAVLIYPKFENKKIYKCNMLYNFYKQQNKQMPQRIFK